MTHRTSNSLRVLALAATIVVANGSLHAEDFCRVQRLEPALDPGYMTQLPRLAATTIGDTQWLAVGAFPANPQSPVLLYRRALGDGPDAPWISEILSTPGWPASAAVLDISVASNLMAVITTSPSGVSVFRNVGGAWQFEATLPSAPGAGVAAVAVGVHATGNGVIERIVAGIPVGPADAKVRIHRNDGAGWYVEQSRPLPMGVSEYGRAVATDGHRVVVGMGKSPWPGRADVFAPGEGGFALEQSLEQPFAGVDSSFQFGRAVAIGADSIVVGTSRDNVFFQGIVDCYGRDDRSGTWLHGDSVSGPAGLSVNLGRRLATAVDGDELVVAAATQSGSQTLPTFFPPQLLRVQAGAIVDQCPLFTTTPWGLQNLGPSVAVLAGERPTAFVSVPADTMSPLPRGTIRVFEPDGPDCDADGVADGCVIDADPWLDCDASGVPDSCEIAAGALADVNGDAAPDICQPPTCALLPLDSLLAPGGTGEIAADGDTLAVGAPMGTAPGKVLVFERSAGTWAQTATIVAPDGVNGTFGTLIALRGDVLVVGETNPGPRIWAFLRSGGAWGAGQQLDQGGFAGALATDGVRIATLVEPPDFSRLRIWTFTGATWTIEQQLSNVVGPNFSGAYRLAIDGNRAALRWATNTMRILRHDATWSFEQDVTVSDVASGTIASVALDPDRIVIGHAGIASPGVLGGGASVFERRGATWSHVQNLVRLGDAPWTNIGASLAADGDWVAIAAPAPTNGAHFGAAWIGRWNDAVIVPQRWLTIEPLGAADGYAKRVAVIDDGEGGATVFVQAVPTSGDPRIHRFAFGPSDCDGSGFDDVCEIAAGFVADNNGNGVPDACDNPADLNGDGVVDGADLGILLGNWNGGGVGDVNGDGTVDGADLGVLLSWW